jgi:hypothetical protein
MLVLWVRRAALVAAGLACGMACAADPGDSPKGDGSSEIITKPADAGSGGDVVMAAETEGPLPDRTAPPAETGPPPEEASTGDETPDDSPVGDETTVPETSVGTGCAAGSTTITIAANSNSGNFGVTTAVCIVLMGNVNGWQASNVQGRTVTVTGATTSSPAITGDSLSNQPAVSAGSDGFIYWNYTGGTGAVPYASMSVF